MTFKINNIT